MYELRHLGLYKNVPKKRMFNPTPDYDRDAYTLLQYKSHLRNEFLIPLKANGDGSGVATIRLQSLETQSVKITGNGKFYTTSAGTTELGTESTIGTTLGSLYVKVPAGESCYLVCGMADKLSGLGNTSTNVIADGDNVPYINYCAINYPLINLSEIVLSGVSNSAFTGSIDNTPSLTRLDLANNLLSAFTGSIDNTPDLMFLSLSNNLLSSFTGDIGKIVKCIYFRIHINTNCTFTYVTRRNNWAFSQNQIWVSCASMTSTMVDNLLIDLDASGAMPTGVGRINLNGLCGAVTSASETARASLVNKGFIVTVNT
jgi:hypothetical protein